MAREILKTRATYILDGNVITVAEVRPWRPGKPSDAARLVYRGLACQITPYLQRSEIQPISAPGAFEEKVVDYMASEKGHMIAYSGSLPSSDIPRVLAFAFSQSADRDESGNKIPKHCVVDQFGVTCRTDLRDSKVGASMERDSRLIACGGIIKALLSKLRPDMQVIIPAHSHDTRDGYLFRAFGFEPMDTQYPWTQEGAMLARAGIGAQIMLDDPYFYLEEITGTIASQKA